MTIKFNCQKCNVLVDRLNKGLCEECMRKHKQEQILIFNYREVKRKLFNRGVWTMIILKTIIGLIFMILGLFFIKENVPETLTGVLLFLAGWTVLRNYRKSST